MASTDARALLIVPTTPTRSGNGLAMRQAVFHDSLRDVARIDTLVLPIAGPAPGRDFTAEFGPVSAIPVAGRQDTRFMLLSQIADARQRLEQFRAYGRGSRHAALSVPVLAEVKAAIGAGDYDLVHVGRLYLAEAALAAEARTLGTLDLDEDDAWAWRQVAQGQPAEGQPAEGAAWSEAEADAEDRLLARVAPRFSEVFVSGSADQASLAVRHPRIATEIIENAIAFPASTQRSDDGQTLLFVGALGYAPNRDGLRWFLREVWPRLRSETGRRIRLRVVGAPIPAEIAELTIEGLELLGAVPDLAPLYREATLALAPLHTGGGTRLKLIEAAAYRVPMVATSIAARGLDFASADSMWLADSARDFGDAILAALHDPAARQARADKARQRASALHDRAGVVDRLASRFAALLARRPAEREAQ